MAALAPSCAAPVATVPPPDPQPVSSAPPPPKEPSPPVVNTAPVQQVIVIHQADLHGQVEQKQGGTITIRALLMMTKTRPAEGNKGVLFLMPADAHGDANWVPLGDVEVHKPLDPAGRIQVKILDEKKFTLPGGKKPVSLGKNTRVKLRWEW